MNKYGWILRVYPIYSLDKYRLVFKVDNKILTRDIEYRPKIYLTGYEPDIRELIRGLDASQYLIDYGVEEWFKPPWYRTLKKVWYITLYGPKEYRDVLKWIKEDGRYRLWNTYPEDTQQMMYNLKLSTSTLVNIDRLSLAEDPWSIHYNPPAFKRIRLRILDWYGDVIHPFKYPPKVYEAIFFDWNEYRTYTSIDRLLDDIIEYSPDVFEFLNTSAYIWFKNQHRIFRDKRRVYIDYGWNVLEPNEYPGYIELSRLSKVDVHEVSRYSIGKVLTTIEAYYAMDLKRLIPDIRTDMENFKTLDKLAKVDRGGYIHTPDPGLYFNVAQCDFTSLYPSIIVKYNIGNETVNFYKCREYIEVPESKHKICMDIPSTVAYTLEKILSRRIKLKDLARETGDPIIYSRQNALKWILVTCFGYLGYRNARFGKIEAYESVTSYARNIMYRAIEIAREMGFKVIHALVDSIWIYREDASKEDYLKYCRKVSEETGFRMELDTYYRWLYIPRTRDGEAALNRYLGATFEGGYKAKGIELVRRDSPNIVKKMQREVLEILSKADDINDLAKYHKRVVDVINKYREMLRNRDVNPVDLIIVKRVGKELNKYLSNQPHIKASKSLGIEKPFLIKYIMAEEAVPIEKWRAYGRYDIKYYLDVLDRASWIKEITYNAKKRLQKLSME